MVVSNTGPLISAFQSDSLGIITALFGTVHERIYQAAKEGEK